MRLLPAVAALLIAAALGPPARGQSSGWRGDGSGRYPAADPPTHWNIDQAANIRWQTKVGRGQSSPVAVGERVFLTAEPHRLLCLDLSSGRVLWERANGYEGLPEGVPKPTRPPGAHRDCGYSTPSPVSDGRCVWAAYGSGIVVGYDLEGRRQWVRLIDEELLTEYGRTASPLLVGGKLLVTMSALMALDPRTGETLWQAPAAKAAYGTPAVARLGEAEVAVTPRGDCVRLSDGKLLARKLGKMEFCSPLILQGIVYFAGEPAVAIRLPERAEEPFEPRKLWECEDVEGDFYGSPLLHEGVLYCLGNEGVLFAVDAASGKLIYRKELDLPAAGGKAGAEPANLYGSLTLAGEHLLLTNDLGESLVLAPGRQSAQVAHNYLDKGSGASPVPIGKYLLLRGGEKLYCIGAR